MTEEERRDLESIGGFNPIPGPHFEDDTVSELGESVAAGDGTVIAGDTAEVIALRALLEQKQAEIDALRERIAL